MIEKKILISFLFIIFFVLPGIAFAEMNCCSTNGGAYACDYVTGKLYCKDGTVSTQCACHLANTPTPVPKPKPTSSPTPVTPVCPNFSKYDAGLKTCKCNKGYTVNNNACISYAEYCWTNYGGNSKYDSSLKNCVCEQGYTWNNEGKSCISMNDLCRNKIGSKSYYNSDKNTCDCYQGYSIQSNKCQLIPTQILVTPQKTSENIITNTPIPSPSPTIMVTKIPILSPTNSFLIKISPVTSNYIVEKKIRRGLFMQFLENIWKFILNLFYFHNSV
jgi:hypothetical protein